MKDRTDRAALLQAVLAAPDEDTPRLVFADWLEENGEGVRAEFIRAMLAEPHAAIDGALQNYSNRVQRAFIDFFHTGRSGVAGIEMHDEIREMPSRRNFHYVCSEPNGKTSLRLVAAGGIFITYRRGFIAELQGPLAALFEHGPAIVREHPVTACEVMGIELVECSDSEITDWHFAMPRGLPTWLTGELGFILYRTREAAMSDLNAVVLTRLRAAAGTSATQAPQNVPARNWNR